MVVLQDRKWIEAKYHEYCKSGAGIEKHLPRLRALASDLNVIELGVDIGRSTTAFLLSAKTLISVDRVRTRQALEIKEHAGDNWSFFKADTREIDLPECDLLFIDTTHTYAHLRKELEKHGKRARHLMVFHDTVTFGSHGEGSWPPRMRTDMKAPEPANQQELGIRPAIDEYMVAYREWSILEHRPYGHGLLVLAKKGTAT